MGCIFLPWAEEENCEGNVSENRNLFSCIVSARGWKIRAVDQARRTILSDNTAKEMDLGLNPNVILCNL